MKNKPKIQDSIRELEDLMLQLHSWEDAASFIKGDNSYRFSYLLVSAASVIENYRKLIEDLK